jgi:hypothetical protein
MPAHRGPRVDFLADAQRAVDYADRQLALQVLLRLCSAGERAAAAIPELMAEALIATARIQRDDRDRAILATHRRRHAAAQKILALLRDAHLGPDDLEAIQDALDQRRRRDAERRAADAPRLLEAAHATTTAALTGRQGTALAVKLGRGYVEVKYIPHAASGRLNGPYLYQRWLDGKTRRSRYLGKASSATT